MGKKLTAFIASVTGICIMTATSFTAVAAPVSDSIISEKTKSDEIAAEIQNIQENITNITLAEDTLKDDPENIKKDSKDPDISGEDNEPVNDPIDYKTKYSVDNNKQDSTGRKSDQDITSPEEVPYQDTQDKEHSIAGKASEDNEDLRDARAVSSGNVPAAWAGSPTIGNVKALVVRIGFDDYTLDEEAGDCLTTGEIMNYFTGVDPEDYPYESLSAYYARSSYGSFRIFPGQIVDYTAPGKREDYTAKSGGKKELALVNDALNAVDDIVDLKEYDADGDGYADLVYFIYAGPDEDWGSSWWPHCKAENSGFLSIDDTGIRKYVFTGAASKQIIIHESGHMIGLPDYYSYMEGVHEDIGITDMMNDNYGDHNGFSKWTLGWLSEENIIYIDKNTKEETISLTPIDSSDKTGKKLAVIAPDNERDIHSEYLLVEYVSGQGNMSELEMGYPYPEGFRIFHVSAETDADGFDYIRSNNYGDDEILIKALGNKEVFVSGDEVTPYSSPSTDLYSGFSGFSITDIVTGESPSFRISYSKKENKHTEPEFSILEGNISNMLEATISSSVVLSLTGKNAPDDPVRLEKDGKTFPLYIKADEFDETKFHIQYQQLTEPIEPDTDYTLVLPEGLFAFDDGEPAGEKRLNIKTGNFTKLTDISRESEMHDAYVTRTGLFSYDGGRAAYLAQTGNVSDAGMEFAFTIYENGVSKKSNTFILPIHETVKDVLKMEMTASENGVYILSVQTESATYLVKLNSKGDKLGLVKIDDLVEAVKVGGVIKAVSTVPEEPLGEITIGEGANTGNLWTIDFQKPPRVVSYRYNAYVADGILDINGETYGLPDYDESDGIYYVSIYDKNDRFVRRVRLSENIPIAFCMDGDRIISTGIYLHPDEKGGYLESEIFDLTGKLLSEKNLSSDYYQYMYLAGVKLLPSDWGYTFSYRYTGNTNSANTVMYFLSKDFTQLGYLALPAGSDVVPYKDKAVVVWEDFGYSTLAWTEVSFGGVLPDNGDKKNDDKEHDNNDEKSGGKKEKDGAGRSQGDDANTDETIGNASDPSEKNETGIVAGTKSAVSADTGDPGIRPWIITGLSAASAATFFSFFMIYTKKKTVK